MASSPEIRAMADGIWEISDGGRVRATLIVGKERAILTDTCFGGEIRALCESVTKNPITLVSTHADFDHVGGDAQFDEHFIHTDELAHYRAVLPDAPVPQTVEEGYVFDADPFRLEVVHLPGHTPGSIALLDRAHRFIITGDVVSTAPVFLFGPDRDTEAYRRSLIKLTVLGEEFDTIYPSHGDSPLKGDDLLRQMAALIIVRIGHGTVSETGMDRFPANVKLYSALDRGFYMEEK